MTLLNYEINSEWQSDKIAIKTNFRGKHIFLISSVKLKKSMQFQIYMCLRGCTNSSKAKINGLRIFSNGLSPQIANFWWTGISRNFLHFFAYLKAYYNVPIVYIVYLLVIKIFIEACLSRITTVIEIFHQVIEYQAGAQ